MEPIARVHLWYTHYIKTHIMQTPTIGSSLEGRGGTFRDVGRDKQIRRHHGRGQLPGQDIFSVTRSASGYVRGVHVGPVPRVLHMWHSAENKCHQLSLLQ